MASLSTSENEYDSDGLFSSDEDMLLPPEVRRKAGRPYKKWIQGHTEVEMHQVHCGNCKGLGYNKRHCSRVQ